MDNLNGLQNEMDELFDEMKDNKKYDLQNYIMAKALISGTDDTAILTMDIAGYSVSFQLADIEVIEHFESFLDRSMEYLKTEAGIEQLREIAEEVEEMWPEGPTLEL